jgi:hypothetical protein
MLLIDVFSLLYICIRVSHIQKIGDTASPDKSIFAF